MKRSWFGAGLLVGLLILGFVSQWGSARVHMPIRQTLEQAAQAAEDGNWDRVERLSRQAKKDWDKYLDLSAAISDHDRLEQIEVCFAGLEVLQRSRDETATAAACAELSQQLKALVDSQKLTWQNVL